MFGPVNLPFRSSLCLCRFEKLDITPKSAHKIKPVLERWMKEAEERYVITCKPLLVRSLFTETVPPSPSSHWNRYKGNQSHLNDFMGVEPSKKRKRRTSFTPQALELLNAHFERNTHPSGKSGHCHLYTYSAPTRARRTHTSFCPSTVSSHAQARKSQAWRISWATRGK